MPKCHVTRVNEVPNALHWAIFTNKTIHVPGDERSRQYPGHGYPAYNEEFVSYYAYSDVNEWQLAIEDLVKRQEKFIACQIIPATVQVKTVVEVLHPNMQRPHVETKMCPTCGELAESVYRDGKSTRECCHGHTWLPSEDKQ